MMMMMKWSQSRRREPRREGAQKDLPTVTAGRVAPLTDAWLHELSQLQDGGRKQPDVGLRFPRGAEDGKEGVKSRRVGIEPSGERILTWHSVTSLPSQLGGGCDI